MPHRFSIAEKTNGSRAELALLRWALVVIFLWFGCMKFTHYEAMGIAPLMKNSAIMSWVPAMFGADGSARLIGIVELLTAATLAVGAFIPVASVVGAVMSCVTYIITLTFFVSTPGVAEPSAGGFPAISADIGQFLLKDLVLLAASACLLLASLRRQTEEPTLP